MITASLLRRIMPYSGARADEAAPFLEAARQRFVGDDPNQVAMWLAQIAHESGSLRYTHELASGEAYENRADLGNTHPGDGPRFRGAGYMQVTGRSNFSRCADGTGLDCLAHPELLAVNPGASDSAGWFWQWAKCGPLCLEPDPVLAVTKRINGGTNGLAERRAFYAAAVAALHDAATDEPSHPPVEISHPPVNSAPIVEMGQPDPESPIYPVNVEGQGVPTMLPALIPILASAAAELIPAIGKLLSSSASVPERNQQIATEVLKTVVTATNASNEQEAVEKLKTDPAALQAATTAINAQYLELSEVGGGVEAARKADIAYVTSGEPPWHSPSFLMACMLLPLVYIAVCSAAFQLEIFPDWSLEARISIISSVLGLILGSIVGFYFGMMTSKNRNAVTP